MKIGLYPVIVECMEEGGYHAECPIIQGCHVEGDTYAEAIENLQDAIQIIIASYRELEKPFSEILLTSKNTTAKISR
jgi:predicted RNase H-like HicB family nuclease